MFYDLKGSLMNFLCPQWTKLQIDQSIHNKGKYKYYALLLLNLLDKELTDWRRRDGLDFKYHFINQSEIMNKMAMLKYFSTYIQIAYFLKHLNKTSIAQWRRVGLNFQYHSNNRVGGKFLIKYIKWQCSNVLLQSVS